MAAMCFQGLPGTSRRQGHGRRGRGQPGAGMPLSYADSAGDRPNAPNPGMVESQGTRASTGQTTQPSKDEIEKS
jgi:hypothetical protein